MVFIREVAPRRAIALVARVVYNEPYIALPMRHQVAGEPPRAVYEWRQGGRWARLGAVAQGERALPSPESHRAFITEHYWGYTRQRDGGTLEYQVTHPQWGVWDAALTELPDLTRLYGREWGAALVDPLSVLIADGSAVAVYAGTRAVPRGP